MANSGASENILSQTVDGFAAKVDEYAQGIANRLGTPLSGVQLSPEDAVARWNFSPLGSTVSADAQYFALTMQGMPPGQALAQVYPMRSQLIAGQDINDSIQKATQIAKWAAEQTGQPPPEPQPKTSTLPDAILQQHFAQQQAPVPPSQPAPAPVPAPAPTSPPLGAGAPGPIGPGVTPPAPVPTMAPPAAPPVALPAPAAQPPMGPGPAPMPALGPGPQPIPAVAV